VLSRQALALLHGQDHSRKLVFGTATDTGVQAWLRRWCERELTCPSPSSASSCRCSIPCSPTTVAEPLNVAKPARTALVPVENITRAILVLRGHKVLLDTELATLYGVSTKRFNEQVRRNRNRFPADFMFQLTPEEQRSLRSQFATSKSVPSGRGGRRAFSE
jgi:ORF6N domain